MIKLNTIEKCLITDLLRNCILQNYKELKEYQDKNEYDSIECSVDYIKQLNLLKAKFKLNDIEKIEEQELYN